MDCRWSEKSAVRGKKIFFLRVILISMNVYAVVTCICIAKVIFNSDLTIVKMPTCTRNGCKKEYVAEENKEDSCKFHPGAPV